MPYFRRLAALSVFFPAIVLIPTVAHGQDSGRSVRRLRGIIDKDETWSGHILITDNLEILGATVTVLPATVIEFAYTRKGNHPVLTVGSEHRERGTLILAGTAGEPIIFRTRPDTTAGRIVVYVRNRVVAAPTSDPAANRPPVAAQRPMEIAWQHVRFEDLGFPLAPDRPGTRLRRSESAILFRFVGSSHTLRISDCRFDNTTRLSIDADDRCNIKIEGNRFREPKERASIEILGSRINEAPGSIEVSANRLAGAISLDGAPGTIRNNILIGPNASIVVRGDDSAETTVSGNYVHNTTTQDDGRYCFNSENPNADIRANVFRGGTTCVLTGSRRMTGNVLIGKAHLSSPYVRQSKTHQLVAALPPGAIFQHNLLLGPAHSLLIPEPFRTRPGASPSTPPSEIRNNVFDGLGVSNRAIHLNPPTHGPVKIAVANNLFLRLPSLVFDESRTSTTVIYADHNAYAPPAPRAFEQVEIGGLQPGQPGWQSADVRRQEVKQLALNQTLLEKIPDFDADIASGKLSIAEVRQRLFAAYAPKPESPLIGAGKKSPDAPEDAQPSIGAAATGKP